MPMATDIEYALMAGRAYQSTRSNINLFPDLQALGWTEFFPGISLLHLEVFSA